MVKSYLVLLLACLAVCGNAQTKCRRPRPICINGDDASLVLTIYNHINCADTCLAADCGGGSCVGVNCVCRGGNK